MKKRKIRITDNIQVGSDSIEHLIGKEFFVHSINGYELINENELIVIHERGWLPLGHDEYVFID